MTDQSTPAAASEALAPQLVRFLFDGIAVRGAIVRLKQPWQEILSRRAANSATGAYPEPVTAFAG